MERKHGYAVQLTATLRDKKTGKSQQVQSNVCVVVWPDGRGVESALVEAQKEAILFVGNPDQFELVNTAVMAIQQVGPAYEGRLVEG